MDFANLDLRTASERGSWVHFEYNGEPIFADKAKKKPSRIQIRGMGSKAVMAAFRKVERLEVLRREKMGRTAEAHADAVMAKFQDDIEEAMAALVVASASEWENIVWDGKPMEFTPENVLKLCGPGTLFFGQVDGAIKDMHRLFTNADSA